MPLMQKARKAAPKSFRTEFMKLELVERFLKFLK